MKISPTQYFGNLTLLLDLEAEAEKKEAVRERVKYSPAEAEATGNSIVNLVIREEGFGLGGHFLLGFGKRNETLPLPWTRLGVGSPVIVSEESRGTSSNNEENGWRGIVSAIRRDAIQVALNQFIETEAEKPTFRIDRASDEIARFRQRQAMEAARAASGNSRLEILRDVLIGNAGALFEKSEPLDVFNKNLNASQIEAVQFALSAEDVAILHGPPGTGKTTTLVELIKQITRRGQSVLAVASSNLAVDNLLEKLIAAGEHAIRLGHPARVTPELRAHTLDLLVEHHPDIKIANKLTRDAYALRDQSFKYTRAKPERGEKQAMRDEAKEMLREARQIEEQITSGILIKARIICATATGLDRERLGGKHFDWCIMDEASQCTEPAAWIPIQYAQRLVLAGDPCQLPPTVVSPEAARGGLNISLMERLLNEGGPRKLLDVQYRMHADIMNFSSDAFYDGHLQADESVRSALLVDLPHVSSSPLTECAIHFIDTAGASYDEEPEPDGESRLNPLEAELVIKKVNELMDYGVSAEDIAVISPYSAQVKLLRQKLSKTAAGDGSLSELEIDSVDGFQGREKEAIVVSLVRSNRDGDVGFLADTRRMNVALTRARRKLVVIGDSATITAHPFYEKLVKYFEAVGAYHSVWEE
ncbi:MAG: AAA family ATPase [Anaerolineales bacterium]|nr:AAA family ATPase [Anaerolineales bacterium]